ncbi:CHASE2 domain-containing protein [Methylibium sp.]|uniref:CHASE2 domain-containing protein n=1 Tax=Methylibium sp. TaxID=2067992 RepID=UPI001857E28F|nr:adenylate/guanylate cyclase domain-containing protein [Methylibium sp.]MBA3588729.1 adenylate/guanylate cyclase domain-containing protein [Methylibium sp.]
MRRFVAARLGWLVPVFAVVLAALTYLAEPLPVQVLRHATFDQYQRWKPRAYLPAPVRIIDIDDESLRRLGQWPWPRTRMAQLVAQLQGAGAAAIAFDVVFAEADRTSPMTMLDPAKTPAAVARYVAGLPDHDVVFAQAIAHGGVVLGFATSRGPPGSPAPIPKARFVVIGEAPHPYLHAFSSGVTSLPPLESAAAGHGAITFVPDADGVVRKVPLLVRQGSTLLPSLAAEALRLSQGATNYAVRTVPTEGVGLADVRIGRLLIPTTPQGEVWVRYTEPVPDRYLPAWKVLAGQVPAAELEGHILLIGTSAQGLMDLRFSPMGGVIPGVEVHAQLLEQVLAGEKLERPAWAAAVEALVIVVGGLVVGSVALGTGALLSFGAFLGLAALMCMGGWFAFSTSGWVKQAFSRYISPNLVNYLVDHPQALELGGRRQACSFVFTDLAGFTTQMETMDPAQAVTLLNAYLDRMIAIAFAHQGTLDRIVGDSVAIMFSAPVAQADHPLRAVSCALEMQRFAGQYVADLDARGIAFCQTRIGVHTGEVIVGNFGGATIFDYRALGDPVNTASRLEGANKYLGTLMCASEATLSQCPGVQARPIGRLQLAGKSLPVMAYEPTHIAAPSDGDAAYLQAFELVRAQDPGASSAFERLAGERPQDGLVTLHLRRLRAGLCSDLIQLDGK